MMISYLNLSVRVGWEFKNLNLKPRPCIIQMSNLWHQTSETIMRFWWQCESEPQLKYLYFFFLILFIAIQNIHLDMFILSTYTCTWNKTNIADKQTHIMWIWTIIEQTWSNSKCNAKTTKITQRKIMINNLKIMKTSKLSLITIKYYEVHQHRCYFNWGGRYASS